MKTRTYIIEDKTCELVNEMILHSVPVVGDLLETIDMGSGERILGRVVDASATEVRIDVLEGTVTSDQE